MARLSVGLEVNAAPQAVWDAMVDFPAQGRWMLATTVRALDPEFAVGQRLEALTGVGRLGVLDTMTVTEIDPPRRCVVEHTGGVIRGPGILEVADLGDGRSKLVWTELLDLPLGPLGRLGWPIVRPLVEAGLTVSMHRFAGQVERAVRR